MAAPYWGELPGPKIARNRRSSDADEDHDHYPQTTQSHFQSSVEAPPPLDHNPNLPLASTVNRASVQTTATEANTESTLSPYVSPTNSGLYSNGLAPRPPSYQRPIAAALAESDAADPAARSSRRHSRNPSSLTQETDPSELLASPDGGRGPPVSYRQPRGTVPESDRPQHQHHQQLPDSVDLPAAPGEDMDYAEAYTSRHNGSYRGHGEASQPPGPDASKKASGRRKKSTLQKSPLQRLELTLDSMTKEEKRARVEAAERRARERATRGPGDVPSSNQQDQPRSFQIRESYGDSRQAAAPAAAPAATLPTYREAPGASSRRAHTFQEPDPEPVRERRKPPVGDLGYAAAPVHHSRQHAGTSQPPEPSADIPRRNLSFRERAARDDFNVLGSDRVGQQPRRADTTGSRSGAGAFSLTRSGSNKLQKEAPVDVYAQRREEAERKWALAHGQLDPAAQAPPRASQSQRTRDVEPPAESLSRNKSTAAPKTTDYLEHPDDDIQGIQRRATAPAGRKHYREDSYFPPVAPAVALKQGPRKEEEVEEKKPPPQSAAAQRRVLQRRGSASSSDSGSDSDGSSNSSHQHRISNMLYRGKERMQPGEGLYQPPRWLEEWRKAPVCLLGGSLLTMSKDEPQTGDKYKAWWEGGARRPSQTTGSRQPDSFEGDYEDMNGKSPCYSLQNSYMLMLSQGRLDSSHRYFLSAVLFFGTAECAMTRSHQDLGGLLPRGRSGEAASWL